MRNQVLLALAVLIVFAPVVAGQDAPTATKRVLLLDQGGGGTFRGRFELAFAEALRAGTSMSIDLYKESIDRTRFPGEEQSRLVKEYMQRKYADRDFDVIVAQGTDQFVFAKENRALFGNPSIVAVTAMHTMTRADNITGLEGGVWIDRTIDAVRTLLPSTQWIYVIDGARVNSNYLQGEYERSLRETQPSLGLVYLRDLPLNEVLARIAAAPRRSVVMFVRQSMRTMSEDVDQFEALREVVRVSPAPVFSQLDTYLGHGIVGGLMWDFEKDASRLADMAKRILNGASAAAIPVERASYSLRWDSQQLERWQIPEAHIPADSTILFRRETFLEQYGIYMLGGIALLVAQAILIAALFAQRAKRREIESRNLAILRRLVESEERYTMATAAGRSGVWEWNVETNDLYVGPWLKTFLGFEPHEIPDRFDAWMMHVHPDDREVLTAQAQNYIEGSSPSYDVEFRMLHKDTSVRWIASRGSFVSEAQGSRRMSGTFTDVTEQRQTAETLRQMQSEVDRMSRLAAFGEFTASIAHEVAQPLTSILINARACLRWLGAAGPQDVEQVRRTLPDVVDAAKRADAIIRRNRELFQRQVVERDPVDVNAIVREVALLSVDRLRSELVRLETRLSDGLPKVAGDQVELRQVLMNLLSNAVDAMRDAEPPARILTIATTATADRDQVQISVRDRGVGLDGVDDQRMFTTGYTTKGTGTGVGLSICRTIVSAHGGRIWATGNDGPGATFFVTLPSLAHDDTGRNVGHEQLRVS